MMCQRHRDILTRNRVLLLKNLKVTHVLLACLREDHTLTDEMEEEINAERTHSGKVCTLLDILVRRGHKAFDRFIRALAETDQDATALALDEDLARKYITERDSCRKDAQGSTDAKKYIAERDSCRKDAQDSTDAANDPVILPTPDGIIRTYTDTELEVVLTEINGSDVKEIMDINIQPATNLHEVDDPMVYPMRRLPRGRAVIINNRFFCSTKLGNRDGAEYDMKNLKMLFEQLSFTVIVEENKSAEQIRDLLEAERQHQDHMKADAFVLFLLSHGNQGNIYGIDGKDLSIEDEITAKFDPDHCPGLKGKPKIFFIQACQGKLTDWVADSDKEDPSEFPPGLDEKLFDDLKIADKTGFVPGFHEKSDVVMSYATVKGFLAYRRPDLGSFFVRCLASVFSRRAHSSHLMDMLTEANFLMSHLQTSKHGGCSHLLAEKTDTLNKKLYFFPVPSSTSKSDGSGEK